MSDARGRPADGVGGPCATPRTVRPQPRVRRRRRHALRLVGSLTQYRNISDCQTCTISSYSQDPTSFTDLEDPDNDRLNAGIYGHNKHADANLRRILSLGQVAWGAWSLRQHPKLNTGA